MYYNKNKNEYYAGREWRLGGVMGIPGGKSDAWGARGSDTYTREDS